MVNPGRVHAEVALVLLDHRELVVRCGHLGARHESQRHRSRFLYGLPGATPHNARIGSPRCLGLKCIPVIERPSAARERSIAAFVAICGLNVGENSPNNAMRFMRSDFRPGWSDVRRPQLHVRLRVVQWMESESCVEPVCVPGRERPSTQPAQVRVFKDRA
jgi:hypothetical protein